MLDATTEENSMLHAEIVPPMLQRCRNVGAGGLGSLGLGGVNVPAGAQGAGKLSA